MLSGGSSSGSQSVGSSAAVDLLSMLLTDYMAGDRSLPSGLDRSNTAFLDELDVESAAIYLSDHLLDASILNWTKNENDQYVISLPDIMWEKVQDIQLAMYFDDGEGFVELGRDNIIEFDANGSLLAPEDRTWLSIDGQVVSFFVLRTTGEGDALTTIGKVPAYLNDERVDLILVFDEENPYGYVAGANYDYRNTDVDVIAKNLTEITEGDRLDFICDYYSYDGKYQDSYYLGQTMTVKGDMADMEISNTDVGDGGAKVMYCFTDYYDVEYWTPALDM